MATHRALRTPSPSGPRRNRRGRIRGLTALAVAAFLAQGMVFGAPVALPAIAQTAAAASLPSGFVDETLVTNLSNPTVIAYAPGGRVFVAEKRGIIKTWATVAAFNQNAAPVTTIDIRPDVMNYWDRGLLGLAVDPDWPSSPYIYALYAYDRLPGETAADGPHWNNGDPNNDPCPSPPGGATDGCVITNRLDRITVNTTTGVSSARTQLLVGWCQQFPSHSAGTLAFGPDDMLYVSGGEGASFNGGDQDYGQLGGTLSGTPTPVNPCGDPGGPVGGPMTVATSEGGALRSQGFRRDSSEPAVLNGAVLRLNPATGAAASGNHGGTGLDAIRQRIVAYGLRNPFRMTFQPGTGQLFVGDVGYSTWEEVNRITDTDASGGTPNFGWPCHEGTDSGTYYTTTSLNACTSLDDSDVSGPLYTYRQTSHMASSDGCPPSGGASRASASISGLAFATSSSYPAQYRNGLFVADYSRNCIVVLPAAAGGVPASTAIPFESDAVAPVTLTTDPNGNIVYGDFTNGTIHRIRYQPPVASFTATPSSGAAPLHVDFDGTGSSGPATITSYDWDFGDGSGHGSGSTTTHTYAAGTYTARLTITDSNGMTSTASKTIAANNTAPVVTIDQPTCTTSCWQVGQTITLAAHATDAEDATIPASAYSWHVGLQHCHGPSDCHEHDLVNATGVKTTSFAAPDHDFGSFLRISVTVKDSGGLTTTKTVDEQPKTTQMTVKSSPIDVPLVLDGVAGTGTVGPQDMIVGHSATISAAATQVVGESTYTFSSWSGGGARTHTEGAPVTPITRTANYTLTSGDAPATCAAAPVRTLTTAQVPGKFGSANDVDWVRFTIPTTGWYRIVLGHLPVDGVLSLYSGCSTLITSVNANGLHWEEIIRSLSAGTYAMKITSVGGAQSSSLYHWSVRALSGTTPLLTTTLVASSGLRYVGDIYNTATTPRSVTITARMYSASGTLLKTVSAHPLVPIMAGRSRSPWLLATTKPSGYSYTRISVTSVSSSTPSRLLSVVPAATQLSPTSWQVDGTVTNNQSTTATKVAGVVEVYDTYGTPMNAAALSASPTTLAPGAQATFRITFSGLPGPPMGTTTRARAV